MAMIYETVNSEISNATKEKTIFNGNHLGYRITPNEGYVLHDSNYDTIRSELQTDEETGETIEIETFVLGYHPMSVTCGATYAFTPIEMQDEAGNTVTAYGDRQFYCKLASDVPADQIFGVVEPDHEIM